MRELNEPPNEPALTSREPEKPTSRERQSKSKEHMRNVPGFISTPEFNMVTLNLPNTTKNHPIGDL